MIAWRRVALCGLIWLVPGAARAQVEPVPAPVADVAVAASIDPSMDRSGDPSVEAAVRVADKAALVQSTADEAAAVPQLDTLRTPDSPAFVVLGVAPTDIQKPSTPRELAVSLSAFVARGDEVTIPRSLAIEAAPYWFWSHGRLTYDDYASASAGQLLRNLTVSLGTHGDDIEDAMGDVAPDVDMATGARTSWGSAPRLQKCKAFDGALTAMADKLALQLTPAERDALMARLVADHRRDIADALVIAKVPAAELAGLGATERAERADALFAAMTERERLVLGMKYLAAELATRKQQRVLEADTAGAMTKKLEEIRTACAAATADRTHQISLAGAAAWHFPAAEAGDGDLVAQAYWATYAYTSDAHNTLVALARVRADEAAIGWDVFVDAGIRAIVERNRYAASIEIVARAYAHGENDDIDDAQYRVAAALDYAVVDGSWLTITFGKDFAEGEAGSLFSLANLSWAFGEPKVAKPKAAAAP